MLELFADAVRYSRNETFMAEHVGAAARIGGYLLRARCATRNSHSRCQPSCFCMSCCPDFEFRGQCRADAVAKFPAGDPRHGLI